MGAYILKRLAMAVATIYVVLTLTFFLIRVMPGSAASYLEAQLHAEGGYTPQQIAEKVQEVYGVLPTGPVWKQYLQYIANVARGNLGTSIIDPGKTVVSIIAGALPWTLLIVALALLISFVVGSVIGTLIAAYPESALAKLVTGTVSFLSAVPNYIIAILLIWLVADDYHMLPASGAYSLLTTPGANLAFIGSVLKHAILPVCAYVVVSFGGWALTMKGCVTTVLGADYVRAAESWGLSKRRLTESYIGRNAMLPMVTNLALSIGYMFGGSVFIETFFVYPGIGYYLIVAVDERDYSLMMGCFLLITVAVILSNLVVDLAYPLVDPRIMSPGNARRLKARSQDNGGSGGTATDEAGAESNGAAASPLGSAVVFGGGGGQ